MSHSSDLVIITRDPSPWIQRRLVEFHTWKTLGLDRIIVVGEKPFQGNSDLFEYILCRDQGPMMKRRAGFLASAATQVFFNDDDVSFDPRVLGFQSPESTPLLRAGLYNNPSGASTSGRAYNLLCNEWVRSAPTSRTHFLGGAFVLWNCPRDPDLWRDIPGVGGEEDVFANRWCQRGWKMVLDERISFPHSSERGFCSFMKRAFCQGRAAVLSGMPLGQPTGFHSLRRAQGLEKFWVAAHGAGLLLGVLTAKWFLQQASDATQTRTSINSVSQSRP